MTAAEARAAEEAAHEKYRHAKKLLEQTSDPYSNDHGKAIQSVNFLLHDYHEARLQRQLAETAEETAQRTKADAAAEALRQSTLPKPTHIPGRIQPKWCTPK
jgi:hypothetical protein